MPVAPFTLVNKVAYSHTSLTARLYGIQVLSLKEVDWKVSVERGEVKGQAREVIGFTEGTVKYEFSMTLNRAEWLDVKSRVRIVNSRAPMDVESDFVIQIASRGMPTVTYQIHIVGLTEEDQSSSAGNDPLDVKLAANVLFIKENGLPLVENSIF